MSVESPRGGRCLSVHFMLHFFWAEKVLLFLHRARGEAKRKRRVSRRAGMVSLWFAGVECARVQRAGQFASTTMNEIARHSLVSSVCDRRDREEESISSQCRQERENVSHI